MKKVAKRTTKTEAPIAETGTSAQEPRSAKKTTTRPGKKVISLIVDERWAARVALCAKAEGVSQTELIVSAVSKGLKGRLDAALEHLKADLDE